MSPGKSVNNSGKFSSKLIGDDLPTIATKITIELSLAVLKRVHEVMRTGRRK